MKKFFLIVLSIFCIKINAMDRQQIDYAARARCEEISCMARGLRDFYHEQDEFLSVSDRKIVAHYIATGHFKRPCNISDKQYKSDIEKWCAMIQAVQNDVSWYTGLYCGNDYRVDAQWTKDSCLKEQTCDPIFRISLRALSDLFVLHHKSYVDYNG